MKLSITIIGHREADHLQELLPQLHWADEVVYVDCESADGSLEIATEQGCRSFSRPNNPNLNVNKSYAMEQAQGEWVFYLDPDERIPEALSREILRVIESPGPHAAFRLRRRNHWFGRWLRYGSQYPDTQLRLFQRGAAEFPNRHVHEKLQVNGSIGELGEDMLHFPYRTVSQFLRKFDFYTGVEAGYLQEAGETICWRSALRFLVLKPWPRFFRRFVLKGGFRDGLPGFFCAWFDAMNFVVRYVKLWELERGSSEVPGSQR
ncbi:MAG: glycosyltransferase family 2 protein [bacterium]